MGKEIKILSSEITAAGEKKRLEYELQVGDKKGRLWFATSEKWAEYFCDEVADGVVVTLLLYAIRAGYDIVSEVPVSKALLNRLNNHVIPQLALCTKDSYRTKLICPIYDKEFAPVRVATAMSMGVDSFTTFFEYTKDCPPESERIDLLTHFESGQTSFVPDEHGLFAEQLSDAERFAEEYGYDLLDVSSNIYELYVNLFWEEWMIHMSTYRNCGIVLLFQKLIKTYYYSSSYNLEIFHCSLTEDVTHYEKWLLPNISTLATTIYNSNKAMDRIEKTAYISRYPETYNYLQVCVFDRHSCGTCDKCLRTMFTLEHLGVLDKYRAVFDVDTFRKNRKHNLVRLMHFRKSELNDDVLELYRDEITPYMRLMGRLMHIRFYNEKVFRFVNRLTAKLPFLRVFGKLVP